MQITNIYSFLMAHMEGRDYTEVFQHMDDEFVDWVEYLRKWFMRNVEHAIDTMDEATGADHEMFYNICNDFFYQLIYSDYIQVIYSDYIPTREGLVKRCVYMLNFIFQIAEAICECEK